MTTQPTQVLDGPLGGNAYDLEGEVGESIDLNSAAGVCTYEFVLSEEDEVVLRYVGPATPSDD